MKIEADVIATVEVCKECGGDFFRRYKSWGAVRVFCGENCQRQYHLKLFRTNHREEFNTKARERMRRLRANRNKS